MVVGTAAEAEVVAAGTYHRWNDFVELFMRNSTVDYILAVRSGAPPQILLVFDVCSVEELVISMNKCHPLELP